jgi:hypothetical protein
VHSTFVIVPDATFSIGTQSYHRIRVFLQIAGRHSRGGLHLAHALNRARSQQYQPIAHILQIGGGAWSSTCGAVVNSNTTACATFCNYNATDHIFENSQHVAEAGRHSAQGQHSNPSRTAVAVRRARSLVVTFSSGTQLHRNLPREPCSGGWSSTIGAAIHLVQL